MPKSRYYMLKHDKDTNPNAVPIKVTHHGVRDLSGNYEFMLMGINGVREFHAEINLEKLVAQTIRMKVGRHNKILSYDAGANITIAPIDKHYAKKLARKRDFHEKLHAEPTSGRPYHDDVGSWSGL